MALDRSLLFKGVHVPWTTHNRDIATNGEIRFQRFRHPEWKPNKGERYEVWCVYMTSGSNQLILGYVWKVDGYFWRARQPEQPWRGKFKSKKSAANALRAAFL